MAKTAAPASRLTGKMLLTKCLAALTLYLGFLPLFLLPGASFLPGHPWAALFLPLGGLLFTLAAWTAPGKRRRIVFLLALLTQMSLCAAVLIPIRPLVLLLALPCLVQMLMLMPALSRPSGLEWPASRLAFGVLLHLIGQALKGIPELSGAGPALSLSFSLYLLLCLFAFNRFALLDASGEEQAPPVKLLNKNRRILAVFSVIAILAANWHSFESALLAVLSFIKRAVAAIMLFLSSLLPGMASIQQQGQSGGLDLSEFGEAPEPSAFALFLEKVLMVVAYILAAALVIFALYHLYRLVKRMLTRLLDRLRAYTRAIGEGYVDKTESLFHLGDAVKTAREKWAAFYKRHQRQPAWESLSPVDKVRRVYALLLRRMKAPSPSLTAREALRDGGLALPDSQRQQIASLYEQARYSSHPVREEDADAMRKSAGV